MEALDHDTELWPTKAGAWRTASLMTGTLKGLKDGVLAGVLALARR